MAYFNANNGLNTDRATHHSLDSNLCPKSLSNSLMKIECKCDEEFVQFCKMHSISHSDCFNSKKVKCDLCSVIADVKSIQWHLNSDKHKERHLKLMEHVFLLSIPNPSQYHCNKLSQLLNNNFSRIAINSFNLLKREKVVEKINLLLKRNGLNDFSVRLYGSSINGFGLKNSDINIDLIMNSSVSSTLGLEPQQQYESAALVLSKVSDIIAKDRKSNDFSNVRNDYNLKVPKVHFTDRENRLECELSITAEKSFRSSKLLNQYAMIDERVRILGTALREWARSYGFDDQENGLWPAFAFPLLVIHFLQRCSPPVLPCLHELFPRNTSDGTQAQENNSVASPKVGFDDNEALEEEFDLSLLDQKWQKSNNKSVGELWLEMLRYYSVEFDLETLVVSIRNTRSLQTHRDKHWTTRMLAIEDPCRPSLNLSRSVGSMRLYNVFVDQLRHTYKYFAIPFINSMPNNSYNNVRSRPLFTERDFDILVDQIDYYNNINVNDLITQMSYVCMELNNDFETKPKKESDESESEEENKRKEENFHLKSKRLLKTYGIRMVLSKEIQSRIRSIPKEQIVHSFQFNRMPYFQKPPKYCRLCRRYNHQQNRCPDERLPDLVPLPDLMHHNLCLDQICFDLFYAFKMDQSDEDMYGLVMQDLELFIRNKMPNAKLELFGSTKNGFGARKCDLDICLTFEDNETGEGLEYAEIIENVGQLLRYHTSIKNITPITSAKVPIVKFTYFMNPRESIDCDISLYNILARFNTLLLRAYCLIDQRVQILGFIVKHFAKVSLKCNIFSNITLNSKAITLIFVKKKTFLSKDLRYM